MSSRMHPDDLKDLAAMVASQVASLLSGGSIAVTPAPPMTIAQQAITLAKQGRIEESKALLRAHSQRRS